MVTKDLQIAVTDKFDQRCFWYSYLSTAEVDNLDRYPVRLNKVFTHGRD